jgi:hypothetical protein
LFAPTKIQTDKSRPFSGESKGLNNGLRTPSTKPSSPSSLGSGGGRSSDEKELLNNDINTIVEDKVYQNYSTQEIKLDQVSNNESQKNVKLISQNNLNPKPNNKISDPILAKDDTFVQISEQFYETWKDLN